jgi:hypothetical protein
MEDHVTRKEFRELKDDVTDIRDNHLVTITEKLSALTEKVRDLKWFFLGGMAVLGLILGILQVFG